jgi:NADH-quinone oxidoreductase subunit J
LNPAFEVSGITSAAFWAVSALAVASALMVVTVRSVFRAALFLALSFTGVAGLYFLLSAEFIGIVQVLVYVGAVSVLIVFAVMLVRDVASASAGIKRPFAAAVVAGLVAAGLIYVAFETSWQDIGEVRNSNATAGLAGAYTLAVADAPEGAIRAAHPGAPGARSGVLADSTGAIGPLLIKDFLLAFQVMGVLLTAALIGALAVIRQRQQQ